MSAHITLHGTSVTLNHRDLAHISDALLDVNPTLSRTIAVYLETERTDAIVRDNPLVAMDQLGRDILEKSTMLPTMPNVQWKRGLAEIGNMLIALATDWPYDADSAEGAVNELGHAYTELRHWRTLLNDFDFRQNSHDVSQLAARLRTIRTALEV